MILVSLDGFRWDYIERPQAAHLRRLADEGVRAERMIPAFPSKTFPNHYTIATGLSPGVHGIVANNMYDPEFDASFSLRDRDAVQDGRWWGGEPIWVTAERQGVTAGAYFWPGTEAEIAGIRPTYWKPYEHDAPHERRVDQVLEWLRLPAEQRPRFITLYFSDVDSAGHDHGPAPGPELDAAIERVDTSLGHLVAGIDALEDGFDVNLVIVADHGMAEISRERVIALDDYIDTGDVHVVDWTPVLALRADDEEIPGLYEQLHGAHPHLEVYRRQDVPERWLYRDHRRVAPLIAVADEGWSIAARARWEGCPECYDGGTHGYAPELESMGALFVAHGPAFERGLVIPPFANVHVYAMLCHLLGIDAAPNEGSLETLADILVSPPELP